MTAFVEQFTLLGADQLELSPGEWTALTLVDGRPPTLCEVSPSANQRHHLEVCQRRRSAGARAPRWHALKLTIARAFDVEDIGRALVGLALRHETLRHELSLADDEVVRHRHGTDDLRAVVERRLDVVDRPDPVTAHLDAVLDPDAWPAVRALAHVSPGSTELLLAFEPVNADLQSLLIAARDLADLLTSHALLPAHPGSFVDYCAFEAERSRVTSETRDQLAPFVAGGQPFDLGLAGCETAPLTYAHAAVADASRMAAFDALVSDLSADAMAAVLGLVAGAVRRATSAPTFSTVVPVQTRVRSRWDESVGWFVEGLPVTLDLDPDRGLDAAITQARERLLRSAARSGPPAHEALASLGIGQGLRRDQFTWTSYVDGRNVRSRGSRGDEVTAATRTEPAGADLDLWFTRSDTGLTLDVRLPETAPARRTVGALVGAVREALDARLGEARTWPQR